MAHIPFGNDPTTSTSSPARPDTADNPLANPAVRDAIELLRDYGITAEQYAAADLTQHWAVPGHEHAFTDEREALAAAQRRADHMAQPVTVTRMCGASGDFAPLDSRRVHPRLGDPTPYALYATRAGGEPVATVDVDGVVNWPAGEHPGDDAPDARAPFVLWAGPVPDDGTIRFSEWDPQPAPAGETWRSTDAPADELAPVADVAGLRVGDQLRFEGGGESRDLVVVSPAEAQPDGTVTFDVADPEAHEQTERLRRQLGRYLPTDAADRG